MKKVTLLLPLICSIILLNACSTIQSHFPAHNQALGHSKPALTGNPVRGEIEFYGFEMYSNGMYLKAKSGAIFPQEIYVYMIASERYDTVYARTSGTWRSYFHVPKPVRGVTTAPNTLKAGDAFSYIELAYQAQKVARIQKAPTQAVVSRSSRTVVQQTPASRPQSAHSPKPQPVPVDIPKPPTPSTSTYKVEKWDEEKQEWIKID